MIFQDSFTVEPWALRETHLDLSLLAQTESVFALSNGHIGWRANLDEGEPHGLPGTLPERRSTSCGRCRTPRAGYGYPESGQTIINVTNGKLIRLLVDDEPFDVRYGELRAHERVLDFRAGAAAAARSSGRRPPGGRSGSPRPGWCRSPSGRSPRSATRSSRSTAGRGSWCSPSWWPTSRCPTAGQDPRAAAVLETPAGQRGARSRREHRGRWSTGPGAAGCASAAAMDHVVDGPGRTRVQVESVPDDVGRVTATARLRARAEAADGQVRRLRLVGAAVAAGAARPGARPRWPRPGRPAGTGCSPSSARYLDDFWDRRRRRGRRRPRGAAGRSGSRCSTCCRPGPAAERRAIPAKGLTGPGYDGHTFWDTETFVLPVLTYTAPDAGRRRAALAALAPCRRRTRARRRSSACAARPSRGARSAARSARATGRPAPPRSTSTPTSPTRSSATSTPPATRRSTASVGLELLVETARLWRSLGHHDATGQFRIDGVTGPDEYSAIADNNVYTNLMAQQNLRAAADAGDAAPGPAPASSASTRRRRPAGATRPTPCCIPYDETLGVHPQAEGFTRHQVWDFAAHAARAVPAAAALPLLRPVPQAGGQAGRPGAGDAAARRRVHRRAEGAQLRLLRARSRCATRRCRPAPRR